MALNLWKLKDFDVANHRPEFLANGKNYYLRIYNLKNTNTICDTIFLTDKKTPFAISPHTRSLLIPISKSTHRVLFVINWILVLLLVAAIVYFYIGGFVNFLVHVAKGKPFERSNIRILRDIILISLGIFSLVLVTNIIYHIAFNHYFNEFIIIDEIKLKSVLKLLPSPLLVILVYVAFKKGYNLQQENDLTI